MRILALFPALALAACATGGDRPPPAEVIRYHLPGGVDRGTATVQRADAAFGSPPFEYAVARQLELAGYPAAGSAPGQFIAVVSVGRRDVAGPPRRSGLTIGLGGGGFSGGRRGGGFGLGGGAAFPVGGSGNSVWLETQLSVIIKRSADQTTIWEGQARGLSRRDADPAVTADRLAAALFTGFPGESGRTISVP